MKTTVVNIRDAACDIYIGRGKGGAIPRQGYGMFGNPIPLKNYRDPAERQRVIDEYRVYFENRLANDAEFAAAVMQLKGKRLGCFCKPLQCHGDVIAEWLENNV
jgi:hypothetical protein